jgi:hypothetical protein
MSIFKPVSEIRTAEPFSAKSVALLTQNRQGSSVRFGFISLVARDSSGRMYFENRRPLAPSGEPLPRTYFIVIDPAEHTRTTGYVATRTCRINAFRHVSYDETEKADEAPRAPRRNPSAWARRRSSR